MTTTLPIHDLAPLGDGIHRAERERIYVDRTLPGDVVEANIQKPSGGLVRAEVVRIIEASPHRVEAPCPSYSVCGGLGIAASCAARIGCSASSTATAAGMAMSRGRANASLSNLEIRGTVTYDSVTQLSKIDGNFGANIALTNASINGTISSHSSWTVNGQGSATGALSFAVLPDRTYCAMTNLPISANWSGTVVTTTAVTVDDNGTAAGSAGAILTLRVN